VSAVARMVLHAGSMFGSVALLDMQLVMRMRLAAYPRIVGELCC